MPIRTLDRNSTLEKYELLICNSCKMEEGNFNTFKVNDRINYFILQWQQKGVNHQGSSDYDFKIKEFVQVDSSYFEGHEVLDLACGFNNKVKDMFIFYANMVQVIDKAGKIYSRVICSMWAGCEGRPYYWLARYNTEECAHLISKEFKRIFESAKELDIVAHSMGCREALKIIRKMNTRDETKIPIDHVVILSPAINSNAFEPGGEFADVPKLCNQITAYFTADDTLIEYAYPFMEMTLMRGMGFAGIHDINQTPPNVVEVDATRFAHNHNDYIQQILFGYLQTRDHITIDPDKRSLELEIDGTITAKANPNRAKPLYVPSAIARRIYQYVISKFEGAHERMFAHQ